MSMHKHKCPCGKIWEHDFERIVNFSDDAFDRAHTCPSCGRTDITKMYFGGKPAECLHDGGVCLPPDPAVVEAHRQARLATGKSLRKLILKGGSLLKGGHR